MKTKFLLGTAVGALVLSGAAIKTTQQITKESAAPFLHPLAIARSLCGDDGDGLAKRRAFFVRAAAAYAKEVADEESTPQGTAPWVTPAAVSYEITTNDPEAQGWFNQGLAFVYGFNHAEAVKSFRRAQSVDPDCAMCFWGEALALGPNINAPMADEAIEPAFAAVDRAMKRMQGASDKEQTLIKALRQRYASGPTGDRSDLDNAFADAMDEAANKYPDDDFVLALAAEANMDTQPWNYWADGGRTPKGRAAQTLSLLETVLARNPTQPAAIHLYIHMTEASRNPFRAAKFADRLAGLAPDLGHLVHMPSHTYYRIGRFKDSLNHNIAAVAADEAYLSGADASILYEYGYYTHNIHFVMTSAQMAGDSETALAMAKKLDEKLPVDMATAAPWVQPIKAAPYYAMAQFADPADIIAAPDPGEAMPFLKGVWHYARGEAFAKSGDHDAAQAQVEAISGLIANGDLQALVDGGVPAVDILNIARLTVMARSAAAQGRFANAIEAMEEATAIQDAIPYTEPPFWYYPSKQTLAAILLQAGEAERAEQLFLESLATSPNNAWVLFGLSESYKEQGDKSGAKYARNLFKDAWLGGRKALPALSQL